MAAILLLGKRVHEVLIWDAGLLEGGQVHEQQHTAGVAAPGTLSEAMQLESALLLVLDDLLLMGQC